MLKLTNILRITCLGILLVSMDISPALGQDMNWHPFEKALAMTDTSNRHILVNVTAPWCGWCQKMKKEVYPALDDILTDHFILTHLNRDDNSTTHRYEGRQFSSTRLAQHFKVQQVPAIVLLSPKGEYLMHIPGFIEADALKPLLQYFASQAYRHQSFKQFKTEQQNL